MLNDLASRKQSRGSTSSDVKETNVSSTARRRVLNVNRTGISPQQPSGDKDSPATLPRRRPGPRGVTPSPEVLSAALDRKFSVFCQIKHNELQSIA